MKWFQMEYSKLWNVQIFGLKNHNFNFKVIPFFNFLSRFIEKIMTI